MNPESFVLDIIAQEILSFLHQDSIKNLNGDLYVT